MRVILIAITASASFAMTTPAMADTLRDALVQAYNSNPTLLGARARLRQTDENVPLAKAQGRPELSASSLLTENLRRSRAAFVSPQRQLSIGVAAELPIYQGGSVRNQIRAAKNRVEAGRADLRATEAELFTEVVAAYMDVIRDEAIVALNANQVAVLETNLRASQDRFTVGDLTRTDVAQSEARLELARGQLDSARARLVASRENYLALVGKSPEDLQSPPALPNMPGDVETATAIALDNNPALLAIHKESDAARNDVGVARATRAPRLSAIASGDHLNYLDSLDAGTTGFPNRATSAAVGLQATLPLYQGGGPGARTRQAQARLNETLEQIVAVERGVIAQTRSAYASYVASQAVIRSSQSAVSANELALEGVRAENSVGTRDVLDVLNAEQELLNSRVQLLSATRDAYVAGFALLASIGKAEARDLGLDGGPLYDPDLNYRRVRNSLLDWSDDGSQAAKATSTRDVAPLPSESLMPMSAIDTQASASSEIPGVTTPAN